MPRPLAALAAVVVTSSLLLADAPKADPVELQIGVQTAMAAADAHLKAGRAAEAVAALEARVADADGGRAFLSLLRKAYTAALADPAADPARAALLRRRLDLLGGPEPVAGAPVGELPGLTPGARPPAAADPVAEARKLFKQQKYAEAAAAFKVAIDGRAEVTQEEVAAWAYCRVKLAADAVNRPACDGPTATAAAADVAEALKLAPANGELQRVGQQVVALARLKSGGSRPAVVADGPAVPSDWQTVESANFVVRFQGDRAAAESLATAAEARRAELFARWSGPAAGGWSPRCELVLHPSADCYARMTGNPAAGTGHATVKLAGGKATARRLDLRADDPTRDAVALPRELTHVVLADLFPHTPPPKWAATGMAVLSGPADEVGRYARALPECAGRGELTPVPALLEAAEFPGADKITGFYCQSASVVDYLVKLKGEKTFVLFLGESGRYGVARSLKTQYGIDGPAALGAAWKRAALDGARAQSP